MQNQLKLVKLWIHEHLKKESLSTKMHNLCYLKTTTPNRAARCQWWWCLVWLATFSPSWCCAPRESIWRYNTWIKIRSFLMLVFFTLRYTIRFYLNKSSKLFDACFFATLSFEHGLLSSVMKQEWRYTIKQFVIATHINTRMHIFSTTRHSGQLLRAFFI